MSNTKTKKITAYAMFIAIAFVVMLVGRFPLIPAVPFLKTDPKDVIIVIAGFIYGPISAFIISLIVSVIEMLTVSQTGPIGLLMNVLSTCAFACTAAAVYKKKRTLSGAVTGLIYGVIMMTALMLLWNYLITPLYMDTTRADIAAMLIPVFLPFNLLKGAINMGLTLLIYKPIVTALRKTKLIGQVVEDSAPNKSRTQGMVLLGFLLLATCALVILVLKGVI
ncbi:MAG: ECF transporter S component [Clostridiales bacterium]|nr:ECF transporter S component [Clostridiales bacterium]